MSTTNAPSGIAAEAKPAKDDGTAANSSKRWFLRRHSTDGVPQSQRKKNTRRRPQEQYKDAPWLDPLLPEKERWKAWDKAKQKEWKARGGVGATTLTRHYNGSAGKGYFASIFGWLAVD